MARAFAPLTDQQPFGCGPPRPGPGGLWMAGQLLLYPEGGNYLGTIRPLEAL